VERFRRCVLLAVASAGIVLALPDQSTSAVRATPTVVLLRSVLDSMNAVFRESNRNWDSLQDLTTLERMLGTVRPTQREYLGCLLGTVRPGGVEVDEFVPARNMRRLQMAVTGSCDSIPGVVGTWHTHPFHADPENRPIKSPVLSRQDLFTFERDGDRVVIVVWDVDSLDAAIRDEAGRVVHPAPISVR
jgi:hypothetical protein